MSRHDITAAATVALPDYRSLAELRYQIRKFLHFSEQAARKAGIESAQHQLLLALKGLPEDVRPTIGVLAERLQIRPHSAVELVNRLAKGGFVRRRRDGETESSDRREVLLEMTAKGERVLRELSRHHGQELQQAGPALIAALQALLGTSMPMRANRGQTPPLNNRQQREGNSKWQRPILTMHRAPR
jgi:DNA-binding MarR family transcriptional regulator